MLIIGGIAGIRGLSVAMFGNSNMTEFVLLFLALLVADVSFGMASSYYRAVSRIAVNTLLQTIELLVTLAAVVMVPLLLHGSLVTTLVVLIAATLLLTLACLVDIALHDGGFGLSATVVRKLLRYHLPLVPTAPTGS